MAVFKLDIRPNLFIRDKLQQLTDKSQGVYFFGHGVQLHSVCVQYLKNDELHRSTG